MNSDRKAQVTLEELLRLKRLEQPPAEFWTQFESELRAKQLAAIVEKRPWWTMSSRFFGVFSRYQLPLGAAAALAIGFAGFREYQALAQGNSAVPLEDRTASARPEDLTVPATSVEALPAAETVAAESVAGSTGVAADSMGLAADLRPADPYPAGARAIPVAAVMEGGPVSGRSLYSQPIDAVPVRNDFPSRNWASRVDSLSGRSIALNVLATRASEPVAVRNLLGPAQNLDSGLVPERASPVPEPLAQMTSPAEEGRARFLSEALPATATWVDTPPPSSDRFVSHLEDDPRLYESISRYGVGSDRLSIKVKF